MSDSAAYAPGRREVLLGFSALALPSPAFAQESRNADYAGWLFFDNGDDMPLQLHCRGEIFSLSFPTANAYAVPLTAHREGTRLELSRGTGERSIRILGTRSEAAFSGRFSQGGVRGTFDMARSAAPLATARRALPEGLFGPYRAANGEVLVLSAWRWGEPRLMDLETGADRTLFALADDGWMLGSALYTPDRDEGRMRIAADGAELRRTGGPAVTFRRLAVRETEIAFMSGGVALRGTLSLPPGAGPHAAVIILGGSDVTVRGDVKPTVGAYLALGMAAFAFDIRGYGTSGGERSNPIATSGADVCAAIAAVARQAGIDSRRIGLHGSSRGGWVGPAAAAQCGAVAFMILVAAPTVSPRAQLTRYRRDRFFRKHPDRAERDRAEAYVALTWRGFEGDAAWARYLDARRDIEGRGWVGDLQGPTDRQSDDYAWLAINRDYDPLPALRAARAPTLAFYGDHDSVVDPAVNAPLLWRHLRRVRDITIRAVPGANHGLYLVDPARPDQDVPVHRARGFAPVYWRTVRRWLEAHHLL